MSIQTYIEKLKEKIGDDVFDRLDNEANKEVSLALAMDLDDKWRKEKYYTSRFLIKELLPEIQLFQKLGLKISPLELVDVLFKCKILLATKTEQEFDQRASQGFSEPYRVDWKDKTMSKDALFEKYLPMIDNSISKRILVTEINSFDTCGNDAGTFFRELFVKLNQPFQIFFEQPSLIPEYQKWEPHQKTYTEEEAKQFFSAPSIAFETTGTSTYSYLHSQAYLRTFLNMLRIASFIYKPQIDFGHEVIVTPPISPVFLGTHSSGCFSWAEDKKEHWYRSPDGSLFLSFGYRGLSKMWLDSRVWVGIEKFFIDYKIIFDYLKNPWGEHNVKDISPTLDILSSATQAQDLGTKVLLIYCCLEHLFFPKNLASTSESDTRYIKGGINALAPDFLDWFTELYKLRCEYAHKGYISHADELTFFIPDSVEKVIILMTKKLNLKMI
jgi:hypothetical protein